MKVKMIKAAKFEPYEKDEFIVVPKDRHNLTYKQNCQRIKEMTKEEALIEINSKIDQITKLFIEVIALTEQAAWNAGIEAAAIRAIEIEENADIYFASEIRKLKK